MHRYELIKHRVDVNAKPWVIVGTGQSIANLKDPENYNVWAINHSIKHLKKCEVLSIFDGQAFREIDYTQYKYNVLLTRTISLSFVDLTDQNLCFVEFEVDQFRMNNVKFFPEQADAHQNSASMAVFILGKFGIKKIYHAGLDGGVGRHSMFMHEKSALSEQGNPISYNRHFDGCKYWAEHFGIELIKL